MEGFKYSRVLKEVAVDVKNGHARRTSHRLEWYTPHRVHRGMKLSVSQLGQLGVQSSVKRVSTTATISASLVRAKLRVTCAAAPACSGDLQHEVFRATLWCRLKTLTTLTTPTVRKALREGLPSPRQFCTQQDTTRRSAAYSSHPLISW